MLPGRTCAKDQAERTWPTGKSLKYQKVGSDIRAGTWVVHLIAILHYATLERSPQPC